MPLYSRNKANKSQEVTMSLSSSPHLQTVKDTSTINMNVASTVPSTTATEETMKDHHENPSKLTFTITKLKTHLFLSGLTIFNKRQITRPVFGLIIFFLVISLHTLSSPEDDITTVLRHHHQQKRRQRHWLLRSLSSSQNSKKHKPRYLSHYTPTLTPQQQQQRQQQQQQQEDYITYHLPIYPTYEHYPTKRLINISLSSLSAQEHLLKSRDYRRGFADPFIEGDCVQQYDWQLISYPTCNNVHEYGFEGLRLVNHGYWRDVWIMNGDDDGSQRQRRHVLKTQRYQHDYEERNYERHRRDALASERLTSSPYVVNIYDYCANTGSFEYAAGGDLNDAIWPRGKRENELSGRDRLGMAVHVAEGVAAVHNFDREGRASIAHTDITPGQFILINGTYKLNDFNRCRFIRWNRKTNEPCPYKVGNNPGDFRSPEEYAYEEQSEKVDVYSMGNIFYVLLTESYPFPNIKKDKDKWKIVMNGGRPFINKYLRNSTDLVTKALIQATQMCHVHDAKKRASARDVLTFLKGQWEALVMNDSGWSQQIIT